MSLGPSDGPVSCHVTTESLEDAVTVTKNCSFVCGTPAAVVTKVVLLGEIGEIVILGAVACLNTSTKSIPTPKLYKLRVGGRTGCMKTPGDEAVIVAGAWTNCAAVVIGGRYIARLIEPKTCNGV